MLLPFCFFFFVDQYAGRRKRQKTAESDKRRRIGLRRNEWKFDDEW